MDSGILILVLLVFVVALLVILLRSGRGKAILSMFGVQISAETEGEQPHPLNVIETEEGSTTRSNWQGAKKDSPGQNVIRTTSKSTTEDNVQQIQ